MRAAAALWIMGTALLLEALKYDPDAGNRLLIDEHPTSDEGGWQ